MCKCLEKEKVTASSNHDKIGPCFGMITLEYRKELRKFYRHRDLKNPEFDMMDRIVNSFAKFCPILDPEKESFAMSDSLNCKALTLGKYYYVKPDHHGELTDTTRVMFMANKYLEQNKKGKTFSSFSIKWKDDCNFTLTLIESNDPFRTALVHPGDKFENEIVLDKDNSITVRSLPNNTELFIEYFK